MMVAMASFGPEPLFRVLLVAVSLRIPVVAEPMVLQELTKMSQGLAACGHAPAQVHHVVGVSIIRHTGK
jgi:hypothetical protein